MSKSATWMPLYIGDYLADTGHLSTEQHGAYLLMLMHEWRTGPLSNDERVLASVARVDLRTWRTKIAPVIMQFFSHTDHGLVQKRLTKEKERCDANYTKKSEAGALGAKGRWGKSKDKPDGKPMANALPPHPFANVQSQSPLEDSVLRTESKPLPSVGDAHKPLRGCRLPEDWTPGPHGAALARKLGLDPKAVFTVFKNFWLAKAGRDAVKMDWSRTWENWCIKDARDSGAKPPAPVDLLTQQPRPSLVSTVSNGL